MISEIRLLLTEAFTFGHFVKTMFSWLCRGKSGDYLSSPVLSKISDTF
jgi:hypothetical protein